MAVKIGVIGVGVHGLHHVRLLSSMNDVEFKGVFDNNAEVCREVAGEFSTTPYYSVDHMLDEVDGVTVAVPTSSHRDVVIHSLESGVSVLVEKPISVNLQEADEMISVADKNNLVLSVGHLERYNPAYRSVSTGDALAPKFIESHRLSVFNPRGTDVAVVLDLMIHDIDVVLDMVKEPVKSVHAVGVAVVTDEIDIANARLEFEGGCVANLTASRISQRKMRKIRMFRKNAYISMDFLTGESEVFKLKDGARPSLEAGTLPQVMDGISYRKYPNDGLNALGLEIEDFVTAVRDGVVPRVSGSDGRKALEVASTIMNTMEVSARSFQ
ncbi:Gfo/Idh/MocA family protein [Candidatus Latescibacterota bacterium]